jgi:hypothetical protein
MTIDNYLALATALMTVCNTIWLSALVIEIRRHNRERRAYNERVSTPINTTPVKSHSPISAPVPPIVYPPIVEHEYW